MDTLKRFWVEFDRGDTLRARWLAHASDQEGAKLVVQRAIGRRLDEATTRILELGTSDSTLGTELPFEVRTLPWQVDPGARGIAWTSVGNRLALFFDGTRNEVEAKSTGTNVLRLYNALDQKSGPDQFAFYSPGVGTLAAARGGRFRRWIGRWADAAFGRGVRQDISDGYRWLMRYWLPGDRVYLFGFSRGAYTARAFAALLETVGLLRSEQENLIPYALGYFWRNFGSFASRIRTSLRNLYNAALLRLRGVWAWRFLRVPSWEQYLGRVSQFSVSFTAEIDVEFMGLWDTVSAIGWRAGRHQLPFLEHVGVHRAWHAVSLDEKRRNYQPEHLPTLSPGFDVRTPYQSYTPGDLEQILATRVQRNEARSGRAQGWRPDPCDFQTMWFAGYHSDVGGTYADHRLSDIALEWIASGAGQCGLTMDLRAPSIASAKIDVDDPQEMARRPNGPRHPLNRLWYLTGVKHRVIRPGDSVHISVLWRQQSESYHSKPLGGHNERYSTPSLWTDGVARRWPIPAGIDAPYASFWADVIDEALLSGLPERCSMEELAKTVISEFVSEAPRSFVRADSDGSVRERRFVDSWEGWIGLWVKNEVENAVGQLQSLRPPHEASGRKLASRLEEAYSDWLRKDRLEALTTKLLDEWEVGFVRPNRILEAHPRLWKRAVETVERMAEDQGLMLLKPDSVRTFVTESGYLDARNALRWMPRNDPLRKAMEAAIRLEEAGFPHPERDAILNGLRGVDIYPAELEREGRQRAMEMILSPSFAYDEREEIYRMLWRRSAEFFWEEAHLRPMNIWRLIDELRHIPVSGDRLPPDAMTRFAAASRQRESSRAELERRGYTREEIKRIEEGDDSPVEGRVGPRYALREPEPKILEVPTRLYE